MIITTAHDLYNTALEKYIGVQRRRLNGSDIDLLREGGWDLVLYVPTAYDPATEKLGDLELTSGMTCTRLAVPLSQQEIDEALHQERLGMTLTPRQFRRGLLQYPGKLQQVEDYIALQSEEDKIDWLHGGSVDRLYPLTVAMITELGFSDAQADNFFRNAASI